MRRTIDTPSSRSRWEKAYDTDLANDYSGIDLHVPTGDVIELSNSEAAEFLTAVSERALARADEAIRRLEQLQ